MDGKFFQKVFQKSSKVSLKSSQNRTKAYQNSIKKLTNIDQKSIKNRSKIDQKSIKIEAQRGSGRIQAPNRVLGSVSGGLGAILEAKMTPTWISRWPQRTAVRISTWAATWVEWLRCLTAFRDLVSSETRFGASPKHFAKWKNTKHAPKTRLNA